MSLGHFALFALLAAASATDIRVRRIPNGLIAFGFCIGFAFGAWDTSWSGLWFSTIGALTAFGLFLPLFLLRALGAGDVKLMMVVGSFVGAFDTVLIGVLSFAASGGLALIEAVAGRRIRELLFNLKSTVFALATRDIELASSLAHASPNRVPFAVAILLGAAGWRIYLY